ncbi:MAG: hypothetical protein ABIS50_22395 [Luteolibacter sp.]|uniref:hypothetical protein n=1 Tax=Luteolibacter sp. TaxID=1962973 RepID=UPI003265D151
MKSCLGILLVFFTFVAVVGGGALIWYLSNTAEFSRKDAAPAAAPGASSSAIPKAKVAVPPAAPKATLPAPSAPPKAHPVR